MHSALTELLGKPIDECKALFVPTGVYPFPDGPNYAWWPIAGKMQSKLVGLGWKSIGLLELTALQSIQNTIWEAAVDEADALLVWGGDPVYLAYWLEHSGLGAKLRSLRSNLVYVGVSAGSMAASAIFGETFDRARGGSGEPLTSEKITYVTPGGYAGRIFETAKGASLVDFAIIPHFENPDHPDACGTNAAQWAHKIPAVVYAIDDQSAIKVAGKEVKVISDGRWQLFDRDK